MTQKDYEKFASNIYLYIQANKDDWDRTSGFKDGFKDCVEIIIDVLQRDNPRFNEDKFRKACGLWNKELPIDIRAVDILRYNWFGVYAHGKLQDQLYTDLLSSTHPLYEINDGIFNPKYKDETLIGFIWTVNNRKKGLIVYPWDKEAVIEARDMFEKKLDRI